MIAKNRNSNMAAILEKTCTVKCSLSKVVPAAEKCYNFIKIRHHHICYLWMVLFTLSIFCVPQLCKQIGSQANVLSKIAVAENVPVHFKVCHISNLFLLNLLPLQVFVFIYCNKSSCVSDTQHCCLWWNFR